MTRMVVWESRDGTLTELDHVVRIVGHAIALIPLPVRETQIEQGQQPRSG